MGCTGLHSREFALTSKLTLRARILLSVQVDKLIDIASPPPRGTGVQNIREIIIENKMTFDVSSDDWQVFLKNKIMNNIERYFYLIVFAMYVRDVGPKEFPQTFKQWMDEREHLRVMIEEGRGKLEWERKIPDEKLGELKDMLDNKNFKVIKRVLLLLYLHTYTVYFVSVSSRRTWVAASSVSTSWRGSSSPICPAATTRTTPCTSWPPRPCSRSSPRGS